MPRLFRTFGTNAAQMTIMGFIDAFAEEFLSQASEEGLGDRVVPTIAPSAYARFSIIRSIEATEVIAPVLTALVRVHDHPPVGLPVPHISHAIGTRYSRSYPAIFVD